MEEWELAVRVGALMGFVSERARVRRNKWRAGQAHAQVGKELEEVCEEVCDVVRGEG